MRYILTVIKVENSDNKVEICGIIISAIFSILTILLAIYDTNEQIKKSRRNTFDNNKYLELLKGIRHCVIYLNEGRIAAWDIQEQIREIIHIIHYRELLKSGEINFGRLLNLFVNDYNRMTNAVNNMYAYYSIMDLTTNDKEKISSILHKLTNVAVKFYPLISSLGELLSVKQSSGVTKNNGPVTKMDKNMIQKVIEYLTRINNIGNHFILGYDTLIKQFALINKENEKITRNGKLNRNKVSKYIRKIKSYIKNRKYMKYNIKWIISYFIIGCLVSFILGIYVNNKTNNVPEYIEALASVAGVLIAFECLLFAKSIFHRRYEVISNHSEDIQHDDQSEFFIDFVNKS